MTEAQARARLRKLLAVTLERGAAPGEQANATRVIGMILQEHPSLRDMLTSREDRPGASGHGAAGAAWEFWKGVALGAGSVAMALGAVALATLSQRHGHH